MNGNCNRVCTKPQSKRGSQRLLTTLIKRAFYATIALWVFGISQVSAAETYQVSGLPGGSPYPSNSPSISGDGRFVVFSSQADDNFPPKFDVYLHDRVEGTTTLFNVSNESSEGPVISADGRFMVWQSEATNLVFPFDENGKQDIFFYDRVTELFARVSPLSIEPNGESSNASVSSDGQFIAFESSASNLDPNNPDENGERDVFLYDRLEGSIELISVGPNGNSANESSFSPSISADGRFVAFVSGASNLDSTPPDGNGHFDIFLYDRLQKSVERVSIGSNGSNGDSFSPSISADGRFVAFESSASNLDLVPPDGNGFRDVFVFDRLEGNVERVSVGPEGSDGGSSNPSISADGRFVAFGSMASNLVPDDINGHRDIFIHDRLDGSIERVSFGFGEINADDESLRPSISSDGRLVAFASYATNLIPDGSESPVGIPREIFVRDRGVECDVADPENQVIVQNGEWVQLALPCLPPGGATVGEIFDSYFESSARYSVFFYNGQNYEPANSETMVQHGQAMWFIHSSADGLPITLQLPEGSRSHSSNHQSNACNPLHIGCRSMPLNTTNWQMVGVPFLIRDGIPLDDILVTTDNGCASGCAISESDPLTDTLFHYQSGQYVEVKGDDKLYPWLGYWASIARGASPVNPALLFPEWRSALVGVEGGGIRELTPDNSSFTLINSGDAMATNIEFYFLGNPVIEFDENTCSAPPRYLAAGTSCTFDVTIIAEEPGDYSATLGVFYDSVYQNTPTFDYRFFLEFTVE